MKILSLCQVLSIALSVCVLRATSMPNNRGSVAASRTYAKSSPQPAEITHPHPPTLSTHAAESSLGDVIVAQSPHLQSLLKKRASDDSPHTHDHEHEETAAPDKISTAGVWVATMVSNLIVTLLAAVGIVIVPMLSAHPRLNAVTMAVLIGLAVGTLSGDACIHLIPEAFELSAGEHSAEHHDHSGTIRISTCVVAGIFLFYLLEHALQAMGHSHSHSHVEHASASQDIKVPECEHRSEVEASSLKQSDATLDSENKGGVSMKEAQYDASKVLPVAWLVIASDAVHNSMDGLVIGYTFAQSWTKGLAATLAIVCHEIPHELGDYAVLLSSGIPKWRSAVYNMACNLTAFIGGIVGIIMSNSISDAARGYVFAVTAGGFLYIALADLTPMLFQMSSQNCSLVQSSADGDSSRLGKGHIVLAQLVGILVGVAVMVLVALYEV